MKNIFIERFDQKVSKVAFGGVIVMDESQADANDFVKEAIKAGVTYFDVAPTYGNAEKRLGPALKPFRKDVFLACKTMERTAEGAQRELDQSLKNMETDYFDLYQLHAVYNLEDVERIFSPGGAMETYIKAKKNGKIRHIGFSAHSTEAALALIDRYDFDSILFPFNFVSLLKNGYGSYVLEKAIENKMAILGIKSMALTEKQKGDDVKHPKAWYHPIEDKNLAHKAVKYTLSREVDVIVPPGNINHFRWAIDYMNMDLKMTQEDLDELEKVAEKMTPLFPLKAR
jgi:aryl-alcohol dehydrogenase-like predicted oxidoreductase